jgi:hypothetical protein
MKNLLLLSAIVPLLALAVSCNNSLLSTTDSIGPSMDRSISFSAWSLQEPNGDTQTSLSGLTDAYFYKDGSYQAFMDTKTGSTTSGSSHPRTEMRETATWKASGTNTLTVTGRVTKLGDGSSGVTTIGQVFNSDDSITLAELQYTPSGFQVLYEESKGNGTTTPLGVSVALNSTYTYKLALSSGKLTITVAGKTFTKTPSSAVSGNNFYFKSGNYDQTATSGAVTTTPYTIVEASSISISHS